MGTRPRPEYDITDIKDHIVDSNKMVGCSLKSTYFFDGVCFVWGFGFGVWVVFWLVGYHPLVGWFELCDQICGLSSPWCWCNSMLWWVSLDLKVFVRLQQKSS